MAKTWIDAKKYDIRVLWTSKDENVPPDAAVVEGWPLDPPDDLPGWFFVDFRVESTKDGDRYCTLWVRPKSKSRGRKRKLLAEPVAVPKTVKKKSGGRKKKAEQEESAAEQAAVEETN